MSAQTPIHNPARTPEALHTILEDAFNRGDLDAYCEVYDDDATLVVPPDGRIAHGRDEIRAATTPMFALEPRMTIVIDKKLETDGLSLIHTRWELELAADGDRTQLSGRSTVVSRRRPDGTWRIVLDDPLSPA